MDAVIPSMIADYWLHVVGLIDDSDFLDLYFRQLVDFAPRSD